MVNLVQRLGQSVVNALEVYWDEALTPSEKNPFPLAPADAVAEGKVSVLSYKRHNRRLEHKGKKVMLPQVRKFREDPGFQVEPKRIVILGAGLLRDIHWIVNAAIMNFPITICDASEVACGKADHFVEEYSLKDDVEIIHADIESAWKDGAINEMDVRAYYGGQFIQNLDEGAKDRVLEHLGNFLRISPSRRVYLLHARGEDNPPETVTWRNTIPYRDIDLREPLERGFHGSVTIDTIGRHRYWNQRYAFLEVKGV